MFESISNRLRGAFSFLGGKLTEANIREGMQQVRKALLEADVNYDVVDSFIKTVTEQSLGEDVLKSVRPSEQIIGIVNDELVNLMGPVDHSFHFQKDGLTILMMCGLQGSGKTTTCGKLAKMLKAQGKKPMLVAADLQRPAAVDQLKVIGDQISVPVHAEEPGKSTPLAVCQNGIKEAKRRGDINVVILDTAGRLHVDDELMQELEQIDNKCQPHQVYLVCDAMTGQDAVNSAKAFNEAMELDGVILTKLDGDTRGGAALSVKHVTGVPIKFIGMGEQLDKLEPFHPDRMAGRILGMGDIVSLVERAQQQLDEGEMAEAQAKMAAGKFTLKDFQKSMKQIRKMGPMGEIMKMIPGMGGMVDAMQNFGDPDKDINHIDGIINSMTPWEREHPDKIDRSRRNRIARGSGSAPNEITNLLKQFEAMSGMMTKMSNMGFLERMRAVQEISKGGMAIPGIDTPMQKQRSARGPADPKAAHEALKKKRKAEREAKKKNRRR